jgi:hypothetical protein
MCAEGAGKSGVVDDPRSLGLIELLGARARWVEQAKEAHDSAPGDLHWGGRARFAATSPTNYRRVSVSARHVPDVTQCLVSLAWGHKTFGEVVDMDDGVRQVGIAKSSVGLPRSRVANTRSPSVDSRTCEP